MKSKNVQIYSNDLSKIITYQQKTYGQLDKLYKAQLLLAFVGYFIKSQVNCRNIIELLNQVSDKEVHNKIIRNQAAFTYRSFSDLFIFDRVSLWCFMIDPIEVKNNIRTHLVNYIIAEKNGLQIGNRNTLQGETNFLQSLSLLNIQIGNGKNLVIFPIPLKHTETKCNECVHRELYYSEDQLEIQITFDLSVKCVTKNYGNEIRYNFVQIYISKFQIEESQINLLQVF